MRVLTFIFLLLSACNTTTQKQSQEVLEDTLINQTHRRENSKTFNSQIIWSTDHVKIWGDTSNGKTRIDYASYKFEPFLSFNDFKVKALFNGQKAAINYQSNVTAKQYKGRLTNIYQEQGLNFAGHYCFVWWGCGSPCKQSAIIDLQDGRVYDGPESALGYDFKNNSTLVIVNPPDSTGFYDDCAYCHPEIWKWNESQKRFEQFLSEKE